ncbi:OPA3-like protein isoform X2 [Cryptomeria japonica]|uniref:OPA3-like protein isoform X2 n=1 Tax=Cryptomeria japonica TaxID=3369 RepID=UPI0025AD4A46|nr:OPA3-like protein isoform X2 [Cryptomeria japonica]
MILPLAKLGALLIKTLSKPIASRLKVQAARHPRFRSLIINVAQTNHKFSTNLQRRIYGHSTDVAVHPLNEEKAVQAATDLLGELFIFSALRQRDDDLARELVLLKQRFDEIEQYARARGIAGIFTLRNSVGTEEKKQTQSAPT